MQSHRCRHHTRRAPNAIATLDSSAAPMNRTIRPPSLIRRNTADHNRAESTASAPSSLLSKLPVFASSSGLPRDVRARTQLLREPAVRKVICFALGPEGTNIVSACRAWISGAEISEKAEIVLCETPEDALRRATVVDDPATIGVFWTCAVYFDEHRLFFDNPATQPFFFEQVMRLDRMQLATRPDLADAFHAGTTKQWRVASHPSPASLLNAWNLTTVDANSNAHAAAMCLDGKVDACITTQRAKDKYGLTTLHTFGSPEMVFFGGITAHGSESLRRIYQDGERQSTPACVDDEAQEQEGGESLAGTSLA